MIIEDDRTELDNAVENGELTIVLLLGGMDSDAGMVHECLEDGDWEEWHRWFLITDASVLTQEELEYWFDSEEEGYAVLGGPDNELVDWGPVSDLLYEDGECDELALAELFAIGDAGGEP